MLTLEEMYDLEIQFDVYIGLLVAPSAIGSQATFVDADFGSCDTFGIHGLVWSPDIKVPIIIVPDSYTSGTQLSGTGVFLNHTFDTLGITPGSYTWSWGSGDSFGSLTLLVVPEPSAVELVLMGAVISCVFRPCVLLKLFRLGDELARFGICKCETL